MNKPVFGKKRIVKSKVPKFKRLFLDIETSYNIVSCWTTGSEISISPDNIIKERAIICICYKWEDSPKTYELHWNKGDDKTLLQKFVKIMNSADEIVAHNGDNFDIKWIRARCLIHGIDMFPNYPSVDTLKLARSSFKLNSNKLDYLAKVLGIGGKMETGGLKLWDAIILKNSREALLKMIDYCKKDVVLLEQVFKKLNPYVKHKVHVGVIEGKSACSCPNCGSMKMQKRGISVSAVGMRKQRMQCQECGKYHSLSLRVLEKNSE